MLTTAYILNSGYAHAFILLFIFHFDKTKRKKKFIYHEQ